MAKPGLLKERADRIKKKLAEGKGKLDPIRERALRKRLKRAQRSRRVATVMESRTKQKVAVKHEEKKEEPAAPPA